MTHLVAAIAFSTIGQPTLTPDTEIDLALGAAGLSTRTARYEPATLNMFRQGEFGTPFMDACFENPWRIPFTMETLRREAGTLGARPSESLVWGSRLTGWGVRRNLLGNPIQATIAESRRDGSLTRVLESWREAGRIASPIPSLAEVPVETQRAAALILLVLPEVLEFRRAAFAQLGEMQGAFTEYSQPGPRVPHIRTDSARLRMLRRIETSYLAAGAYDLFLAVQEAATALAPVPETVSYDVRIPTIWGEIRLTGGGDTRHDGGPSLLIVDTGGNDTYIDMGANRSSANWASIVIDTDGNDLYLSDPALAQTPVAEFEGRRHAGLRPGPGGALFGYAAIVDTKGDDLYRSHRPSQGSGRFGFAMLLDLDGNDVYDAYIDSQGYGEFGAGILEDVAGNDRYEGFNQVQAVGQTGGLGLLLDRAGNDAYVANNTILDFPSPQSAQSNISMAQGAGNGRRADYLDGRNLAGGIGILYDQAGNDTYSAGVFGQGVGYWMGVGMLWDGAGDDRYAGDWYVQGASAHFAVGALDDVSGNDEYSARLNMALGAGHDLGFGVLIDRAGDDRYSGPNLSLGAGNANGFGLFIDLQGNDAYDARGIALGKAAEAPKGSLRSRILCIGVFLDLGGQDTYPAYADWSGNGRRSVNWTDRGIHPTESQFGVFWDR
ncbi:MAG: hypothetical protein SNJ61_04640 [Fimbriimonadaceae bacterium]